jgi:hypothetical protein
MTSRSSNQKRKRKTRRATGVPCETRRRAKAEIINHYLDTPPAALSPQGYAFLRTLVPSSEVH